MQTESIKLILEPVQVRLLSDHLKAFVSPDKQSPFEAHPQRGLIIALLALRERLRSDGHNPLSAAFIQNTAVQAVFWKYYLVLGKQIACADFPKYGFLVQFAHDPMQEIFWNFAW